MSRSVSIVGASGYSGAELLWLLSRHPSVRLGRLFANTSAGKHVAEVYPRFAGKPGSGDLVYEPYSADAACTSDLVFIALPSGEAMRIVPELLDRGKRVVDLGGDFRLSNVREYEEYYRHPHTAPQLFSQAAYGLPEWNKDAIRQAALVANPGCYPTGALLPLLPLIKENLIHSDNIVISALSGVSGAGRTGSVDLSFAEVNESVKAYKVGIHQHIPEIGRALRSFSGREPRFTFVPHLLPITRGIYSTIYAPLTAHTSEDQLNKAFRFYYRDCPFIRVSTTTIPEIRNVLYTNVLEIGFRIDHRSGHLVLMSAIDNLVKGAAGQAVQNMNLMFGFKETEGLA